MLDNEGLAIAAMRLQAPWQTTAQAEQRSHVLASTIADKSATRATLACACKH